MEMKKLFGFLGLVATVAVLCATPVMADSYGTLGGSAYLAGVVTNDELVIGVTNGMEVGVTAENIVLVPFAGVLNATNTITLRAPYQKTGNVYLRVSTSATNKVKIANAAGTLDLGDDWIAAAGGSLALYVPSTALASRVNAGQAVPVLTPQRAVITSTAIANGPSLNLLGIDMSTNAVKNVTNVVVTVVNGGLVVTNMTIALP
jgi:hypothetical protein